MKIALTKVHALTACEYAVAAALTVAALVLHNRALTHGGPLWRDEISSVQLAAMPTIQQFFHWLVFDVFPVFYFLLLRLWIAIGFGENDFQLRLLGFIVGTIVLLSLWLGCRLLDEKLRMPLWPLAFVAINPLVIHDGDSLRAYGLGMIFIILATGLLGRFVTTRDRTALVLAAIAAVFSVQTLYINALLVFAIYAGAGVAMSRRREWPQVVLILGTAMPAALSLLPYAPFFRASYEMRSMQRADSPLSGIVGTCLDVLGGYHPLVVCLWLIVPTVLVVFFAVPALRRRFFVTVDTDRQVFAIATLLFAGLLTIGFLWTSGWLAARYFLPLLTVACLCLHMLIGAMGRYFAVRLTNVLISTAVALLIVPRSYAALATRWTNCDIAATIVAKQAVPGDVVIVSAFTFGISFQRYYHGAAPWKTIPNLSDHTLHRWDLALNAMSLPDPMRDTLGEMANALRQGHKVFIVGALPVPDTTPPETLPSKSTEPNEWPFYEENWRAQVSYFVDRHATNGVELPADENYLINSLEHVGVFVASGWRE